MCIRDRRIADGDRVLVTALTKRLAEDLSAYLCDNGVACKWMHSELDAFERVEHLRDLRMGKFDVLVGVNLLREGLDLPEVSLVAILDADKQGFLRSETSLIQTIGRSARNVNARVILYGDKVTKAMKNAMQETDRRRSLQTAFNEKHGITPKTIIKPIGTDIGQTIRSRKEATDAVARNDKTVYITEELIEELQTEMLKAAEDLEFERAGILRDRIGQLKNAMGEPLDSVESKPSSGGKKGKRRGRKASKRRGSKVPRPRKQD